MKHFFLGFLGLLSTLNGAEPIVKLAGVQTVWQDGQKEFDGFKTLNSEKGTTIAIIISVNEGGIVSFDEKKAKLTLNGKSAKIRFGGDISKDGKHLKLEITGDALSPGELANLKLEGSLPITTASGTKEIRSQSFETKPQTKITFPEGLLPARSLVVEKSGKSQWGDEAFEISLKSNRKFDEFAKVSFTTPEGKEATSKQTGSSSMSFAGNTTAEVSYSFKEPQNSLIMVVSAWTGIETKPLTINLTAADAK